MYYIIYMYYNYIYYNSILTSSSATAFHRTPAISPRRGGNPKFLRLPTGCCPPAIGRALALTG